MPPSASQRENNATRFPNRDPRVARAEQQHTASPSNTAVPPTKESGASPRDPRIKDKHPPKDPPNRAKDSNQNPSVAQKDNSQNEKDPRKRHVSTTPPTKTKERSKPKKKSSSEKQRERAQMSLEGRVLYGAIDTTTQGSSLHKFRIPKIKRPESSQPNHPAVVETRRDNGSSHPPRSGDGKKRRDKSSFPPRGASYKDDANTEVSSSSDSNVVASSSSDVVASNNDASRTKENDVVPAKESDSSGNSISVVEENDRVKVIEADTATKSANDAEKNKKDDTGDVAETGKSAAKDAGLTQEWIEQLIRKSFESGEGKKLVDNAKLIHTLGKVLKTKKLKKIKKIIDSDSVSSFSSDGDGDDDENGGETTKRSKPKKKRRVIVSESSSQDDEDDSLAKKLETLNTESSGKATKSKRPKGKTIKTGDRGGSFAKETGVETNDDEGKEDAPTEKSDKKENDDAPDKDENRTDDRSESNEQQTDSRPKDKEEKKDDRIDEIAEKPSKEQTSPGNDEAERARADAAEAPADKVADKPRAKTKRRNSLDMLHEDIKEMFIGEDVVAATGYRMCRLTKENQSAERSHADNDAREKTSRSRKGANDTTKSKAKTTRKYNKRNKTTANVRSKEHTSSDSEAETPLALRTDKSLQDEQENERRPPAADVEQPRRSKRVTRANEPRVLVEKIADRTMFDSSSDESFGIDVSELTAAVDSSLQREKSSEDPVEKCEKKPRKNAGKRQPKSKKTGLLTDDRSEDELTDADSVLSDISMLSNRLGSAGGAARTCTRNELLSNTLIGLGKDSTSTVKNEDPAEAKTKKLAAGRKKKKKSSWKMGIVTTKKKKKKAAAAPNASPPQAEDDDERDEQANVSTDTADRSEKERDVSEEKPLEEDCSTSDANTSLLATKCEKIEPPDVSDLAEDHKDFGDLNDLLPSEIADREKTTLNDSITFVDETKSLIKMEVEDSVAKTVEESDAAPSATTSTATAPSEPVVTASVTTAEKNAPKSEPTNAPMTNSAKNSSTIIYDKQVKEK